MTSAHIPRNPAQPHRISLLHATRGRADRALKAKQAWLEAARDPLAMEHIFAVDSDDTESLARLGSARHVVVSKEGGGCVAAWNLAAGASCGDVLVQMSDDWVPFKHWDRKIIERFRDVSQPGVLKISDGRRVDDLICMAIFTRAWLDALGGEFLSAEYFGVYSDDEFSFRAYEAGVVIDARDLVFEHQHPNYDGGLAFDDTHRRQNDPGRRSIGRDLFLKRNPQARGRWLHEWTDERHFIPQGHASLMEPAASISGSPAEARRQIQKMKGSISWKLTKPLRWLGGAIRK